MYKKFLSLALALSLVLSSGVGMAFAVDDPATVGITEVSDKAELVAALNDPAVAEILFTGDVTVSAKVIVSRPVVIDGGDHSLLLDTVLPPSDNANKHILGIEGVEGAVVVKNLTIDSCTDMDLDTHGSHGVQAYLSNNVTFDNVTMIHSRGAGFTVNGSTVVANNLVTEHNAWGAVNVDPGDGVVEPSAFTLTGDSVLNEANQIWSDGAHVDEATGATVEIVVPDSFQQGTVGDVIIWFAPRTVMVDTAAELAAAMTDLRDWDTIVMAAGEYDIEKLLGGITTGGQTGWYFPVLKSNVTIKGAGIAATHLFSSTVTSNGAWANQDFISVWGDGVTISDMNITSKIDPNKSIEIMGKDFTLQNVKINASTIRGYEADGNYSGSVYFNPLNAEKNVGDSNIVGVYLDGASISVRTDSVFAGTVTLTDTTLDLRNWAGAVWDGWGIMSKNPEHIVVADNFRILIDGRFIDYQTQVVDRLPAGAIVVQPVAGESRFDTSAQAALASFPAGASTVILATGDHWADALGGSALAGALNAPIMLVSGDALELSVSDALVSLDAQNIIILGGAVAVSEALETALEDDGFAVERIWGATQYDTADKVAGRVISELGAEWDGSALFATGAAHFDALAGSPLAAAKVWPVFLVDPSASAITPGAKAALDGIDKSIILGGQVAVSNEIAGALAASSLVKRLAGDSWADTAAAIAQYGVSYCGLSWDRVALATGEAPFDALVGGVLQAHNGSVMLLTESDVLSAAAESKLAANSDSINSITYLGGSVALSQAVRDAAELAIL